MSWEQAGSLSHSHVFADGNKFHFGRDDPGAGVGELSHDFTRLGTEYLSLGQCAAVEVERRFILTASVHDAAMLFGEIPVINGSHRPSLILLHVAASANPLGAQRRQTFLDAALEPRIAPRATRVINAHGLVYFELAVE